MKRRCIISYASLGRENYPEGIKRMARSAIGISHGINNEEGFILVSPELQGETISEKGISIHFNQSVPFGMPAHKEVPYAFKPWLFHSAFAAGYQQVLWCDSTIVIHKSLSLIWDIAEGLGACLFDNPGCPMRVWTSDDCMEKIGCPFTHEQDGMFNETMACAMAIDYENPKGRETFSEWFSICNDGVSFAGSGGSARPEFRAHRHDQSVISWLAQKNSIPLISYGTLVYNADRRKFPNHIFANTGINEPVLSL